MINKILIGIFKVVISLVNVLLLPINTIINNYLPNLSNVFTLIRSLFNLLFTYMGWVIDSCFISSETVALMVAVITFKLTVPLLLNVIKIIKLVKIL